MSEIKVNKISPKQTCTTVTLGDSGDTFIIPSGVTITNNGTQTGFGRTGTVDWDTTAKTANFTAVSGNGYFVNTTSGAITVTLPATPSAGDIVAIKDYANTADTNAITIARNGSNIDGSANDFVISNEGGSVTLVYVDATKGWLVTDAAQKSDLTLPSFIVATGGTVTCCGDYKIHTFTSPGTFTVTCAGNSAGSNTVDYLVVAGGGGGGGRDGGGGGGGGGFRESSGAASGCYTTSPLGACVSALPVTATGYPITVGAGGAGGCGNTDPGRSSGCNGSNSVFSTITSTGGGGGGRGAGPTLGEPGGNGGSGGGGGGRGGSNPGGTGNTPPVSPPQGTNGGSGKSECTPSFDNGGGGGGATAIGGNGSNDPGNAGSGGTGATTNISGSPLGYGGGAGGGSETGTSSGSSCGSGGAGATTPLLNASTAGTTNRGGGGGGGAANPSPSAGKDGANGGSGIVIIRYKYQ